MLSLARRERPRVCFIGTASGDSPEYVANFFRVFAAHHDCEPSDLALFDRTVADLSAFVLAQDVVYVGGGNTASLLAVWRAHGLDVVLREAWEQGIVLCGSSAGMNCWFEASTTDSFDLRGWRAARRARLPARQRVPALRRRGSAPPALPAAGGRGGLPARVGGRRRGGAGVRGDVAGRGRDHGSGFDRVPGGGGWGGGAARAAPRASPSSRRARRSRTCARASG